MILGLLAFDATSYFAANPSFNPGENYRMGDFLLAADAIDPRAHIQKPPDTGAPDAVPDVPGAGGADPIPAGQEVQPAADTTVDSASL